MKSLFSKVQKTTRINKEAMRQLDVLIQEKYGFSYSETNDDKIIDSLDYGTNAISYAEFTRRMDIYKKNFDNNEPFELFP